MADGIGAGGNAGVESDAKQPASSDRKQGMTRLQSMLLLAGSYLLGPPASSSQNLPDSGVESPQNLLARAAVQMQIGEAGSALEVILDAIDVIGNAEQPDTDLLIDAFIGLGNAYVLEGEYPSAIVAYENASDLSRHEHGLFNIELIDILNRMQWAARVGGDPASASEFQQEAERIPCRDPKRFLPVGRAQIAQP